MAEETEEDVAKTSEAEESTGDELDNKVAKGEVREYDFSRSSPIPKEQRRTISLIHESYGQTLGLSLAAFLRSEVSVSLKDVEQMSFQAYSMSLNDPTCIATYDMQPLSGIGVIEVNSVLVYTIIDRMLGGEGSPPEIARAFTDIELAITRKLLNLLLSNLSEAWNHILTISFGLKDIQTNPAFIRIIPSREACITVTFNVSIGETNGLITLCFPYVALEPIAGKLRNDHINRFRMRQSEDIQQAHMRNFHRLNLDVTPVLGTLQLTMTDLLLLQPGDIVKTHQKARNPIEVRVAGQPKFTAKPGLIGKFKGVSIQSEITKE